MKIGIDISMLVYAGSGVATYTYNLAKALLTYASEHEYRFFYSSFRKPRGFYYLGSLREKGADIVELRFPASISRLCWNKLHIVPVEWFIGKVDAYHSSDYLRPPLAPNTKGITTIHDLTWKLFPQYHTQHVIRHHERKLYKTMKYKDTIIVDSKNTKKDLLRLYPEIDKGRVHVIYPGIDERFRPISDKKKIKKVLQKYLNFKFPARNRYAQSVAGRSLLTFNFLLYVGAIEPRKNLRKAIRVFAELIKEKKYEKYHFVIAGRAGWKNEHIYKLVDDLKLKDKIHFTGFVEDKDLPFFYNAAQAFIYLSVYEGFGFPPIEAARCGIPTLLYHNSSLSETFPKDYPFARRGTELQVLKKILDGKVKIDKRHFAQFTWRNYAKYFLEVISSLK